jgi:hypothetical protein
MIESSIQEACQSGLMYLFAKEAGVLKPLGGSNPPASARKTDCQVAICFDRVAPAQTGEVGMLEYKPTSNGGNSDELAALYLIHAWIKDIVGTRQVSVIRIMEPEALPRHCFSESAIGYNSSGRIILRKKGKTVKDVTWDGVHAHRFQKNVAPTHLNSPQCEISGSEDVCVILQDHNDRSDTIFKGVSLDIFMCPSKKTFGDFESVGAWLAEPKVRKQLEKFR